jgi:hypothetical protein
MATRPLAESGFECSDQAGLLGRRPDFAAASRALRCRRVAAIDLRLPIRTGSRK